MIKRVLPIILCVLVIFSISGVYATWQYTINVANPEKKDLLVSLGSFDYPEIVYITDVDYLSGGGTFTDTNYYRSVLESSVTVPKGTELTFRITVFNNSNVVQGFDGVVSTTSGYDNGNIAYTLTNLKRPYTVDGVMADDVTRIPAQQKHQYEITFKFVENTTDFSNATLNSVLNFVFKPFADIDPEHITSPVDGALEAIKKILNTPEDYAKLYGIMDQSSSTGSYVGNVVGSSSNDTKVLDELFDGNLHLMLTDPETGELVKTNLTCMIKEKDLDGDGKSEMTIYMTPDDLSSAGILSTIKNVYVGVFTQLTNADGTITWEQLGELYHGTSQCNDYDSNIFNGFDQSINTDRWRSSQAYHNVKSGSTLENVIKGYKNSIN
ncbi:MAG: hypothetical protein IKD06_03075 [Clostridia bacterium]|nr:hypothetical protein [Clostridia bacterium]